jgi:signal transduction histidine kinase
MSDGDEASVPPLPETGSGDGGLSGHVRENPRLQDRILYLVLAVLVTASVTLAAYTASIHRSADALRSTSDTLISPGVRTTQEMIVDVSLEVEAFVEAALGGQPGAGEELQRYGRARRTALARLDSITERIGGDARLGYERLGRSSELWEALLARPDTKRGMPNGYPAREVDALSRSILLDATALQRTLYRDLDRARGEIDAAERVDWYLTLGLSVVALLASLFTAWLVRRIRGLADLSERRRVEALAANAHRARLLRGITHDVKNPLGAADGSAQLLEMGIGGALNQAQRETVGRIRRGIGGALTIVSDLLELSRADTESVSIERAPTDVAGMLEEIAQDYGPQAERAGISLISRISPALPAVVTDGKRVRQIVGNLLSNAIKYTPVKGRVCIVAEVRGDGRGGARRWLAIDVADTGAGIPRDELDRIFEEFYRAGPAGSRPAGTGLGLTISRRLARLLGGDLGVASEPGKGSTFTLSLPADGGGSASPPPSPA